MNTIFKMLYSFIHFNGRNNSNILKEWNVQVVMYLLLKSGHAWMIFKDYKI